MDAVSSATLKAIGKAAISSSSMPVHVPKTVLSRPLGVEKALLGTILASQRRGPRQTKEARPEKVLETTGSFWEKAPPQERLAAEEVARQDVYRQLVEYIYGLKLSGGAIVYDFVLQSRDVAAQVEGTVRGMEEKECRHLEDGTCEVVMQIDVGTIREILRGALRPSREGEKLSLVAFEGEPDDKAIEFVGSAGLPDSPGLAKVRARRAAQIDALAKQLVTQVAIHNDAEFFAAWNLDWPGMEAVKAAVAAAAIFLADAISLFIPQLKK